MGLKSFLDSCMRLFKLMDKLERKELWATIRIGLIGLAAIGALGFIIKFLATMFQSAPPTT